MVFSRPAYVLMGLVLVAAPLSGCFGEEIDSAQAPDEAGSEPDDPGGPNASPGGTPDAREGSEEDPSSEVTWESDSVSGEVAGAVGTNALGPQENPKQFQVFQNATRAIFNVTLDGQGEIAVYLFRPSTDPCGGADHSIETEDQTATFDVEAPAPGSWSVCVYSTVLGAAQGSWTLTSESKVVI